VFSNIFIIYIGMPTTLCHRRAICHFSPGIYFGLGDFANARI